MTRGRLLLGISAAAVLCAAAGACALRFADGPLGMLPGGRLEGEPSRVPPGDWGFAAGAETLELEVGPESPRSMTVWFVVHAAELFVSADFLTPFKRWPHRLVEDPRARVRVAGRIHAARAQRVEDPERIAALRQAFADKYALEPDSLAARAEVWFFRLDSVPPPGGFRPGRGAS